MGQVLDKKDVLMKTIGLIGGLGWRATVSYYEYLNKRGNAYLGKTHSPHIIIDSLDLEKLGHMLKINDDTGIMNFFLHSTDRLISSGAELIAICCNSAHKVAENILPKLGEQFIDIRHAVVEELLKLHVDCVALFGTTTTMEQSFYRNELESANISCLIPEISERKYINAVIDELSIDIIKQEAKKKFIAIGDTMIKKGAQAILLACTELPLLLSQADFEIPVIDTILVHADKIFRLATRE